MFCWRASGGPLPALPGFSGFRSRKLDYELAVLIFTQLQFKNMNRTDSCTVKPCDDWANRCFWKGSNRAPRAPRAQDMCVCARACVRLLPGWTVWNEGSWLARRICEAKAAQGVSKEGLREANSLFQVPAQLCDVMPVTFLRPHSSEPQFPPLWKGMVPCFTEMLEDVSDSPRTAGQPQASSPSCDCSSQHSALPAASDPWDFLPSPFVNFL